MIALTVISAIGVAASLAYYAGATFTALRFASRSAMPPPPLPKIAPRVAVLKPLHGLTDSLGANTVSFLEASYPRLEFVFGVSDYEDAAAEIPVALKPRYQFANITLSVGEEPGCANRKVAKLIKMAERAPKAEIFILSDADVSVDRGHLLRVVGELLENPATGLVTCIYRARATQMLASRLEALYVNTDMAPMAILSAAIEPLRHAFGATIAIRRAALDAIGGFGVLKQKLADDFFLGRMTAEHGWGVKLSGSIATVACEETQFSEFWRHQLRWARTYRTVRPVSLAALLVHGPFWAIILVAASACHAYAAGLLALVIGGRIAMSAIVVTRVLRLPVTLGDLCLVVVKDLAMTAVWFASLLSNHVVWAGRKFRIEAGGAMREIQG